MSPFRPGTITIILGILLIMVSTGICQAQAPTSGQAPASGPPLKPGATARAPQSGAASNETNAWRERWIKEYWAREEERQRKLKEAKPAVAHAGAAASPAGKAVETQKSAAAPTQPPTGSASARPSESPAASPPNHPENAQKPVQLPQPSANSAAASKPVTRASAPAKPAPAKQPELIGSQAKPDILTGPDIGKDHTIDSPLQAVGDGWKMIAYLVPTLVFIVVCLNLMRRYQQKTGRLSSGLQTAGRDFGRTSQSIGSAVAGLFSLGKFGSSKNESGQSIRLLESLTIGTSSLHLVQVRGHVLLLSSSPTGVTLLSELKDEADGNIGDFRSALQSAAADMDGLDITDGEMPISAVVGSLEENMRETGEAMARRLRRLRMVSEPEDWDK